MRQRTTTTQSQSYTPISHSNPHAMSNSQPNQSHHSNPNTRRGTQLSTSFLLQSTPTHFGPIYKFHIPILYTFLPPFLQSILHYIPFAAWLGLIPSWKNRFLICLGNYLYRFTHGRAKHVKGSPLPLESIQVEHVSTRNYTSMQDMHDSEMSIYLSNLPNHIGGCFTLRSPNGTKRYYGTRTREEAQMWVSTLSQQRQECITRNMGHAKDVPYPRRWEYVDLMGKELVERKRRVKEVMERRERREMEMSVFSEGVGGVMPSGYYG